MSKYRTIRQINIDDNLQPIHLHVTVSNIDERMNQQFTDTQDGDDTYLTLKGQEAANISAPSTVQHQCRPAIIIMIHIYTKIVTLYNSI